MPCRRRRRQCLCCIKHTASGICLLQLPIYSCPPICSCLIGSCTFAAVTPFCTLATSRSRVVLLLRAGRSRREYACTSECTPEPQNARHTSECHSERGKKSLPRQCQRSLVCVNFFFLYFFGAKRWPRVRLSLRNATIVMTLQ